MSIGSSYSRELCCGTHVNSTGQIEDFLIARVDSRGQSNKRLYCLTGAFAKHVRDLFENDFQKKFHWLEAHRNFIPIDELFTECQHLREIYLDEKSFLFPYNQRAEYVHRWKELIPDKKILRRYLSNQLHEDLTKNFIHSYVDLPIYEIGFMLLRYDDEKQMRKHQPFVIYVNYQQKISIIYLKNPRQRERLIEQMKNRYQMNAMTNFDDYDQQTRELFTVTKKLVVFHPEDEQSFDQMDFSRISSELFSDVF